MTSKGIDFQLVPPGCHRRNAAERAIRTFKNHFVAGLCSTDPKFPLLLWCRLLLQAELAMNLLRPSHINPKVSAYNQLYGIFDFTRTPLAPPGTRVLGYVDAGKHKSWSSHGRHGWYIAPAMEAYQCYKVYTTDTRAVITCNQVEWFPTKVTMPSPSTEDIIIAKLNDIAHALRNPTKPAPVLSNDVTTSEKLKSILKLLQNITAPTIAPAADKPTQPTATPRVESTQPIQLNNQPIKQQSPNLQGLSLIHI